MLGKRWNWTCEADIFPLRWWFQTWWNLLIEKDQITKSPTRNKHTWYTQTFTICHKPSEIKHHFKNQLFLFEKKHQPFKVVLFLRVIYASNAIFFPPPKTQADDTFAFFLVKLRVDEQMRLLMVSEKVAVVSQKMSSICTVQFVLREGCWWDFCVFVSSDFFRVSKKIGVHVDVLRRILDGFYSTSSEKKTSHIPKVYSGQKQRKKLKDFPIDVPFHQNGMHHNNSSPPKPIRHTPRWEKSYFGSSGKGCLLLIQ